MAWLWGVKLVRAKHIPTARFSPSAVRPPTPGAGSSSAAPSFRPATTAAQHNQTQFPGSAIPAPVSSTRSAPAAGPTAPGARPACLPASSTGLPPSLASCSCPTLFRTQCSASAISTIKRYSYKFYLVFLYSYIFARFVLFINVLLYFNLANIGN